MGGPRSLTQWREFGVNATQHITYWTTLQSVNEADMSAVLTKFGIAGTEQISEAVAKQAAADVLDRVATTMAMQSGVTRVEDISIDRSKPASELRALAARLRADVADLADPGVAVVEFAPYPHGIAW